MSNPVDPQWLKAALVKYNTAGPRYTSYPTAPQWVDIEPSRVEAVAAEQASRPDRPLSVYVHIPFCERRCLYCGCNVIIRPHRESVGEEYIGWFEKELALRTRHFGPNRKLVQFHFGGGTPTFLSPEQLERVSKMVLSRFQRQPEMEFSIEIDPCLVEPEHIERLRAIGLNRISLGVQDFDQEVQALVKRYQKEDETAKVIGWARAAGINFVNVDLIYGLPGQTLATFDRSIDLLIEMGATRVAIYSYAHVPWIRPHQKRIDTDRLPDPETKLSLYLLAYRKLTAAGFVAIGMDHFARPDDELTLAQQQGTLHRNFMGYTTRAGSDLLGMGISAISFSADRYTQNYKDLPNYQKALGEGRLPIEKICAMSEDDKVRSDLITQLLCNFKLPLASFESRHHIRFDDYFREERPALESLQREGLLKVSPDALEVSDQGRFFVRNIAMVFDAYLKKPRTEDRPLYSQTV